MAKAKPLKGTVSMQASPPPGPYLATAVIAEKLLTESDSTPSVIRIIDRIGVRAEGLDTSGESHVALPLVMVVSFRGGDFHGQAVAMITQEGFSGETEPLGVSRIDFSGPPTAMYTLQAPVNLKWEGEGQYWFNIYLDNKFYSRIPLAVGIGDLPPANPSAKNKGKKSK